MKGKTYNILLIQHYVCSWFCFTGLLLGAGLLFFFVKYKNLQKNFSKLHEKEHDEDEMTVYHEDMQADSPDVIFSDRSRKGKKFYKDSEKVPLGDHDELSMI